MLVLVLAAAIFLNCLPGATQRILQLLYPRQYATEVESWAEEYEIDPLLVYAVIHTESSFNTKAESSVGARGLMQMTEETFYWIKSKIASGEDVTFEELYTPSVSIRFGAYYLRLCLDRYRQDVATAAAAYHSGWGTVDALLNQSEYTLDGVTLSQFPYVQMNHYVEKILRSYQRYTELYGG